MNICSMDVESGAAFPEKAKEHFAQFLPGAVPAHFSTFVDHYFHQYPLHELIGCEWQDVFGCVFGLWQFIQHLDSDARKVRVFNPDLEDHGWVSGHTVVAVLHRDMPFLVDSIRIEINRRSMAIHTIKSTVMALQRDSDGRLRDIVRFTDKNNSKQQREALIFFEINLLTSESERSDLASSIDSVLQEVALVVDSYADLVKQMQVVLENLLLIEKLSVQGKVNVGELQRSEDFLRWLASNHFTFLGYREYELVEEDGRQVLSELIDKRLGLAKKIEDSDRKVSLIGQYPGVLEFHQSDKIITFAKSSVRSRVHRSAYADQVVIKRFDQAGRVCGESRFSGLYTSVVYSRGPDNIPIVAEKIDDVLRRSGLDPRSHDGKLLRQVLDTFPRDELFLSTTDELYDTTVKVAQINERYQVRLFMRRGHYGKFVSCLVYVPRDLFTTAVRLKIQRAIGDAVGAIEEEFTTYFSESILARVHLVFRVNPDDVKQYDVAQLQEKIVDIVRSWEDNLSNALVESFGEGEGLRLFKLYKNAFSYGYREMYDARAAVHDIEFAHGIEEDSDIALSFYKPLGADDRSVCFKVFRRGSMLELSDVIPVLENLGLRVIGEMPYQIRVTEGSDRKAVWLHDFSLRYDLPVVIDVHAARNYFQEAFAAIWHGEAESDEFNRLVLGARLNWREVAMLRAYAAYMKQTLFNFSQSYIANTLSHHLEITRNLVALFRASFDPRFSQRSEKELERVARLQQKITDSLETVENLNEDRIIRRYLDMISGTLRTNFFQTDADGNHKSYISLKFAPRQIGDIPEPRPLFEIFVYSPRMEGVHLRGGKVARGGLRWSDRLEDYRTEVLGLVKAQQVKNAVIVPQGAKGGFVCKRLTSSMSRDEFIAEGIECYKTLIRGLLDITDNLVDNRVVVPDKVVRTDEDDPYLVVAADKGTATFSDIANGISADYGFWLGDAFASGGSQGYDHKGMGITAKGAWVGVRRHFKELGIDIQTQDFTVIGIGDMSGDVFGNGMLLSEHICLVAAFNHQHIFIDPNPGAADSFVERRRLFALPKSSWADYGADLISEGGGVFSRSAKSIRITPQMQQRFAIQEKQLTPNALINALLKAPVDLLWNGGIGTYVKATRESHGDVGDKTNDALRVNGKDLRCRVFGEGGNLGMTQLGRVEFALNGGACNTDFIDNSAGVDCSDHEVNIKILLNELVANGDLTQKQRNQLLAAMTDAVADLVLEDNYAQTQAISIAQYQAVVRMGEYRRFINTFEAAGHLIRRLEFIPDDDVLLERQANGQALTRPELSVLMSYAKVMLKSALQSAELCDDAYIGRAVEGAFPAVLTEKYQDAVYRHRLKREIVATQLANDMINHMGITFCQRLMESTGSTPVQIGKAYAAARDIYQLHSFQQQVEALDHKVPAELQLSLQVNIIRRVRRATRWFLRNRRSVIDPALEVEQFLPVIKQIYGGLPDMLRGVAREEWDAEYNRLVDLGLPSEVAAVVAMPSNLYSGLGMVEAGRVSEAGAMKAAEVYYTLGDKIQLHWFANQISEVKVESYWQAMARESYIDDLEAQIRSLAISIIQLSPPDKTIEQTVDAWMAYHEGLIKRWRTMVSELQSASGADFAMFSVALRELLDLAQASQHCQSLNFAADVAVTDSSTPGAA